MENLKKCPICNCTPISFVDEIGVDEIGNSINGIVLRCPDINCDFPYAIGDTDEALAIKRWNRCCEQWNRENKTNEVN